MPWRQVTPMDERRTMMAGLRCGLFSVTEASRNWGVSRKSIYKWLKRYEADGTAGLEDRSRAPHACPHRTPQEVVEAIEDVRRAHPTWGPRKILEYMRRHQLYLGDLPAPSTAGDILKRAGLVPKRRRRRQPLAAPPLSVAAAAVNDLWCADFKGEFMTGDGKWCYPFTVTDQHSRFILVCRALPSTAHEAVRAVLEALFREVGLPHAIRTDNGCPFGSASTFGLSRLVVWLMKLGIQHDPIQPGKPQQNGSHERMHRTLKSETARPPAASAAAQQARFDTFRWVYNHIRPHEGIGMRTPADIWTPSPRPMPATLPEPEYAGHMHVRRVRANGEIRFRGESLFLSEVLADEHVALEEVDDGIWSIVLYRTELGRFDERSNLIIPAGRSNRPQV